MQLFVLAILMGLASSEFLHNRVYRTAPIDTPTIKDVPGSDTKGKMTFINQDGKSCECVPYYLCRDNITYSGDVIVDIRGGVDCESYIDVCCENPEPNQIA